MCCSRYHHHHHHHHHHHLSLNREGRWGTTDDFTSSFLHFPLFSSALWHLTNSRSVHSLMSCSHSSSVYFVGISYRKERSLALAASRGRKRTELPIISRLKATTHHRILSYDGLFLTSPSDSVLCLIPILITYKTLSDGEVKVCLLPKRL